MKLGLRQVDSILSMLFNLVLEIVIRLIKIRLDEGVRLQNSSIDFIGVCRQFSTHGKIHRMH